MDLFKSLLNEMDEDTLHTLTMKASNILLLNKIKIKQNSLKFSIASTGGNYNTFRVVYKSTS